MSSPDLYPYTLVLIPHPPFSLRTNLDEVAAHCKAMQLAAPVFEYKGGKDNKVCALLHIGPNVFKGAYVKSEAQAAESAAGVALLQLVRVGLNKLIVWEG
jgi:hypothetical protein